MKIYLASSWKNQKAVLKMAGILESNGFEVDAFCRDGKRFAFHWSELIDSEDSLQNYDAISFMDEPRVKRAFAEDRKWLDWADCVVMMKPCGNSAHLEAGYAKGKGKRLYILGPLPKGQFDVMYGLADGIYRESEIDALMAAMKKIQ